MHGGHDTCDIGSLRMPPAATLVDKLQIGAAPHRSQQRSLKLKEIRTLIGMVRKIERLLTSEQSLRSMQSGRHVSICSDNVGGYGFQNACIEGSFWLVSDR